MKGLRERYPEMTEEEWREAVREAELEHFRATHRFCGRCGAKMQPASEISVRCPDCGEEVFPRLNPAIVVLVLDEEKALLVRAKNFRRPMFALVAGFVETAETLEECVAREVREETSLEIEDIRYWGSQSWPFPSQLMIAFTARLKKGTDGNSALRLADGELAEAGWFTREEPPTLPTPPSLSRRLIDAWLSGTVI